MILYQTFTFTAGWQELLMIGFYFLILLGIGIYAFKKSTSSLDEYTLGGRNIGPWVTALSAGASDMSGWMLMGLPGAAYSGGLSAAWIAVGLTLGALVNYLIVAPRLRVYSEVSNNSITIPDFFENRFKDSKHILRIVSGVVIVFFFLIYASANFVAGGTLFENAFNIDYTWGLLITASIVVFYTFIGGYFAVSLTDMFQGTIMFISIIMIPIAAWMTLTGNGIQPMVTLDDIGQMNDINYTAMFQGIGVLTVLNGLAWGLGYFGQPHIIVRFMSAKSVKTVKRAKYIGISWMAISLVGSLLTGLIGLVYVTENPNHSVSNPETILILMSQVLFHPFVGGFILAAILAAIMSTISSQLLVTSSSLVQDLYRITREKMIKKETKTEAELDKMYVLASRIAVILVSIIAILIALMDNSAILDIVANAWAGFGAAFGPLVVLALHWKRFTRTGAIASMISGAVTVILWVYVLGETGSDLFGVYSMIPGVIVSVIFAIVGSLLTQHELEEEMEREFDETTRLVNVND